MNQPYMAYLTDMRMRTKTFRQLFGQEGSPFFSLFQNPVLLKNGENRKTGRASKRIAAVGVAVHKCFSLVIVGIECLIYLLCRNGDSHRHIAACQPFGYAHDVRADTGMLESEHFSCPAKPGSYLVRYQQDSRLITELSEFLEVNRRINPHAGASLEQRLNNDRACLLSVPFKCRFCLSKAFRLTAVPAFAIRTAVAIRRFYLNSIHQHRFIDSRIQIHAPDR